MNLKNKDWGYLLFFLATAVVLEGVAAWSSIDVFPSMKGKILLAAGATMLLAYLIHQIADEEDLSLRQNGVIVLSILNVALLYNCIQHFEFGREIDAAKQSAVERDAYADKELARQRERTNMALQVANANTQQISEGRKTLLHTPRQQAGKFMEKLQSSLITVPSTQATPEPPPATTADGDPVTIKTPAEVRAQLMPDLFFGLILSFGVSVLGATFLYGYKLWDKNGNGIRDWIERAAQYLGEEAFAKRYPQYYWQHKDQLFPGKA
jgi:hypothetical protein